MSGRRWALRAGRPRTAAVAALVRRLGAGAGEHGLERLLADLDRRAVACEVPGSAAGRGFAWDDADSADAAWWPQGVACLRGGDVVLVGWYRQRRRGVLGGGSRVSVVDRSDPEHPRYRHVELVAPRRWWPRPGRVRVHAGGLAVVGDLLYVADTLRGVRLFRLADAVRGPRGWVLPQHRRLVVPLRSARDLLRWSFVSTALVDGPDGEPRLSLLAGEYRRAGGDPRLLRYALDASTGLPVGVGAGGRSAPVEHHAGQPARLQGVAAHGSTWYASASAGEGRPGDLYVGRPGAWVRHRGVLPTGCEDLDWSVPGEVLWCATEWPGRRWVFPVDVRSGVVGGSTSP